MPAQERESVTPLGDMALHHHTDPGAITLLLQDNAGGLQALSRVDGWIDVPPLDGAIVVNIGDILQVWTNDRCSAGVHRVVPVTNPSGRFSIPFFYQPKVDAVVEPWLGVAEAPRYRAFSWQEYIRGRVTDNYSDIGEEDIQIDRYKVAYRANIGRVLHPFALRSRWGVGEHRTPLSAGDTGTIGDVRH